MAYSGVLRDIREFLTPQSAPADALGNALMREQQRQLSAMAWLAGIVSLVNGLSIFIILQWQSPNHWAALWCAIVVVTAFGLLRIWSRHRDAEAPEEVSGRYLRRAEHAALVLGTIWGLAVYCVDRSDLLTSYFVFVIVIGMATGFCALTSPLPRISLRFAVPCIGVSGFYFIVQGGLIGSATASLSTILISALAMGGIQSKRQLLEVVRSVSLARDARRDLFEAIEAIGDAFAIHDKSGDLVMSNRNFRKWFPDGVDLQNWTNDSVRRMSDGTWVMCSLVPIANGRSVSIHTDVTALKMREQELMAARRDAEEASAAKGRFMSTMSHELLTPLNIINGFSRLMSSDSNIEIGEKDMREYADSVQAAGEHLLTVINDIIEFSRVGGERYMHDPEAIDAREVLANAISLAASFNRVTDLSGLDVSVSPSLGELVVDEAAFRRILINLVSNAMKFGGQPLRIAIRAFLTDDGSPAITIRDFGPGISEGDLEKVFDPFYQCETDRGGEFSGTGLGLTLSRELARLHGGDVKLTSREGVGTTASIILPASAHIPLDRAKPASDASGEGVAA